MTPACPRGLGGQLASAYPKTPAGGGAARCGGTGPAAARKLAFRFRSSRDAASSARLGGLPPAGRGARRARGTWRVWREGHEGRMARGVRVAPAAGKGGRGQSAVRTRVCRRLEKPGKRGTSQPRRVLMGKVPSVCFCKDGPTRRHKSNVGGGRKKACGVRGVSAHPARPARHPRGVANQGFL